LPKLFTKPRGHIARYPLDSLERLGSVCSASHPFHLTHTNKHVRASKQLYR